MALPFLPPDVSKPSEPRTGLGYIPSRDLRERAELIPNTDTALWMDGREMTFGPSVRPISDTYTPAAPATSPTTLGPDGQTEKPKNPYIERLFRRPRLSPSEGVERGSWDRTWLHAEATKRQSLLGMTEAAVYGNLPEAFDPRNPMEVEHGLRFAHIEHKQEEYKAMRPARTPLEYLAAGAGFVIGSVQDPTTLAGPTTKFVQAGRTVANRLFRSGVSGSAINVATDPVVQGLRIQTGLQEHYEPRQTALALSLGFALPAAGQGVVEALKPAARVAAGPEAKSSPEATRAASEALSPDASYARQVPPPEPLKPVATMDALSPEDAARKIDEAAAALRAEADIAPDIAAAFPDRPVAAETSFTPAVPLRQEIDGKAVIFPDPQHARLYSLGRVLSEGAEPDGAELQGLAKEFQGFGVETVDDLAVVARDYHAGMTEQAQLSTADTLPARDILPDDAARSAWRDREIERLQESDPARAIIDETLRTVRARFGEEFTPRAPQEFAPTVAFDEVLGIEGIRVFHGSPHEFERFSMEEIGTGEGAQAYGHGLYFAQSRGVAESYKTRLAGERYSIDGHPHDPTNAIEVAQVWRSGFNTLQEAIDDLTEMAVRPPALMPDTERLAAREALQLLKNKPDSVPDAVVTEGGGGALYEARIRAKEEDFLDWDKPLSEQSEKVKAALRGLKKKPGLIASLQTRGTWFEEFNDAVDSEKATGRQLVHWLGARERSLFGADRSAEQTSASKALAEAGIPGIKYLDQGSRAGGEGSRNYVVFDDSLISTVRRNEQLMLRTPESLSSGAGARFQETPSAASAPPAGRTPTTTAEKAAALASRDPVYKHWWDQIEEIDNAPEQTGEWGSSKEQRYRAILSTGSKGALKKGETWRGRVIAFIESAWTRYGPEVMESRQISAERGADGKPQLVLPGAERIAPAEQAQRAADEPLRPTAAQRPMDEGLFGDEAAQTDLMDLVRKPPAAPPVLRDEPIAVADAELLAELPAGYSFKAGKGLGDGKWGIANPSGSLVRNLHDTKELAVRDALAKLRESEQFRAEEAAKSARRQGIANRIIAGEEPTDADIKELGLKTPAGFSWLSPVIQELFGISRAKVREAMGDALKKTFSESGTVYWSADPKAALKNAAQFATAKIQPQGTTFAGERIPEFTPETIPATPGQRAGIFMFDPAELQIDAKAFQFKAGGDVVGATPILKGVSRWNPDAAGQLVVWQRTNGKLFVADGHQRVNLAKRLLEGKAESGIRLPAVLYRESDGFSAEDVMIRAALKNIREGSGDVMDVARILRTQPAAVADIAEISRTQTRQGVQLANLEDSVWRMVLNDVIEPRDGAIIGRLIDDAAVQEAAAKAIARVKPANEAEAEILVRRVVNSELVRSEDASQGSMFGDLDSPDSLVGEETRIVAQAMKVLGRDKNMLKRVAANAARIEETGSKIEREAAVEAADEANRLRAMIESLAFTKGPARDRLLEAAKGLKNGSVTAAGATESFIEGVRLATGPGDAGRSAARGGGRADADTGKGTYGLVSPRRRAPLTGEVERPSAGIAAGSGPEARRLHDISESLKSALGVTVRQGRITKPGALGTYNAQTGVVRLQELDSFKTLSHEGGHAFHLNPANKVAVDEIIARHAVEIRRLTPPGYAQGVEDIEGFAEWFRLWVTSPGWVEREAPGFTTELTQWMAANRPDVFRQMTEVHDAYRKWFMAPSMGLVTGDLVTTARPTLPKRIAEAIGTDKLPTGETLMTVFGRVYQRRWDKLHPLNRLTHVLADIHEKNTGERLNLHARNNPYKLFRLANNSYQAGLIDLKAGVVPYKGLDPEGPSLVEALELATGKNWFGSWRSDELLDFGGYLVARRSIVEAQRHLANEVPNPPGKLTLGDYQQAVRDYEAENPNFTRAADLVYEYQRNAARKDFEAGLTTRTFYERTLEKAGYYVPFQRAFEEKFDEALRAAGGKRGTGRQTIMHTYRGSLRSIINPIESIMEMAFVRAALIARNDAVKLMRDMAHLAGPNGGALVEQIPAHQMKSIRVDAMEALRNAGKEAGINKEDIDELMVEVSEKLGADELMATIYRAGEAPEKGEPIVYLWEGGERKPLLFADTRFGRDVFQAITGIGQEQSNDVINFLAVASGTLRAGITTNPVFLAKNYLKDQVAAFILNPKFIPFVSGGLGAINELRGGVKARRYAQVGGVMGGANTASLNQARINKSITALQTKNYKIHQIRDLRQFLKLTEVTETGTRIALYSQYNKTALKHGLSPLEAHTEAGYQATDFLDFGLNGSKMLFARRVVTFLNSSLQGMAKSLGKTLIGDMMRPMARVYKGLPLSPNDKMMLGRSAGAWAKIAGIMALEQTYVAMYRDDPEFQEASEYLRATNWLFKGLNGEWYTMPKPYDLAVFMNLAERYAEGQMEKDPTWANKWLRSWSYTLMPPLDPVGLTVPAEVMFNRDTFRDKDIVDQRQLGMEPWLQFNGYSSEFSKALGKATNTSPAMIDHVILGFGGSWARDAMAASNALLDPQRRSAELYDWPITGAFVKFLARGSDATEKFYGLIGRTSGRLEQKHNSYNFFIAGQEVERAEYFAQLRDDEKVWVAINEQEKADNKRMHPLRRAGDVGMVLSGIKRDITTRRLLSVLSKEPITITPTIAKGVQDQMTRAASAEMRNAMIVVGEPGWAQRKVIDPQPFYDAIRAVAPTVADEIENRLAKEKVLPFEGVRAVWPELRDRLLEDGTEAFIGDLRPDAMRGGAPRRARATAPQ